MTVYTRFGYADVDLAQFIKKQEKSPPDEDLNKEDSKVEEVKNDKKEEDVKNDDKDDKAKEPS